MGVLQSGALDVGSKPIASLEEAGSWGFSPDYTVLLAIGGDYGKRMSKPLLFQCILFDM